MCLPDYAREAPLANIKMECKRWPEKLLIMGVWNPVSCHGNKPDKLILYRTFRTILLQKYKLAEISVFIIFDQHLVECMTSLG